MISQHSALSIVEQLFPFGFCVNQKGQFTVLFKSFQKYFPKAKIGESFWQYLDPTPGNEAVFPAIERKLAIFKDKSSTVKFRGQFILVDEMYVFAGGLQTQSMKELKAKKLNFKDFSLQDPLFDFLMLISTERASNVELHRTLKSLEFQSQLDAYMQEIAIQLSFCANLEAAIAIINSQLAVVFKNSSCSYYEDLLALPADIQQRISNGENVWQVNDSEAHYYLPVVYNEGNSKYLQFSLVTKCEEIKSVKSFLVILGQLALGVVERDLRQEQANAHYAKQAHSEKLITLGEISAGIAHEINNPLAVIKTSAKATLRGTQVLEPKNSDHLQTIVDMADRISVIIKGLRAYARDGAKDPFESANLQKVIKDSVALCQSKLETKGINITVIVPEYQLMAKCRSVQISQVIVNLINNAVDAIEDLDEKWLRVEAFLQQDSFVRVQVTDSGSGISKEIVQKIMTPFFTTKAPGKGTGLGLSISMGIIAEHGGSFRVDASVPNTCFYFTLPTKIAKAA